MKKPFTPATTILALLLSVSVAVGLYSLLGCLSCGFDTHPRHYPYFYPFCIVTGGVALIVFFLGFWMYIERRMAHPSLIGVVVDVLYSVILVPGFFLLYACAVEFVRELVP